MADQKLEFIISAIDQSKAALDQAKKNLQATGAVAQQASKQVATANQQATSSTQAFAKQTQAAAQTVAQSSRATATAAQQAAAAISSSQVVVINNFKKIEQEGRKTNEALQGLGTTLRGIGMAAFAKSAVDAALKIDSLEMSLTAVTGSAAGSQAQLARLREIARDRGFSFQTLAEGALRLQAAGFSAKDAERAVVAFGNAVRISGGSSEDLQAVFLNLSQIKGMGKLTGDELRESLGRIPILAKVLQQEFGTLNTKVIAELGYTGPQVLEKILRGTEKLPQGTKSARLSFDQLAQAAKEGLEEIGNAIIPIADTLNKTLIPAIKAATDAFKAMPEPLKTATVVGGAAAFAIPGAASTAANLRTAFGRGAAGGSTVAAGAATAAGAGAAGRLAAGAGALLSSPAGLLVVIAGVSAAAAQVLGNAADSGRGKAPVGIRDTLREIVFAIRPELRESTLNKQAADAKAEVQARFRAQGGTPRQQIVAQQAMDRALQQQLQDQQKAAVDATAGSQQDAELQQAQVLGGDTASGQARVVVPVLTRIKQRLTKEAAALFSKVGKDAEATKEYWGKIREAWQVQGQILQLESAVRKEAEQARKKALDEQKKLAEEAADAAKAAITAQREAVEARIATLPEEQQAQARVDTLIPFLAKQAREAIAKRQRAAAGSKDFYDAEAQYWKAIEEAGKIRNEAEQQRAQMEKKAREEALKAAQEAVKGRQGTADAAADLARAQLETLAAINPEAAEGFKRKSLIPALLGKIQGLGLAVPGESPEDAVRRQIQAEQAKQEVLGAAGFGKDQMRFGNLLGGGAVPLFDQRGAMGLYDQLNQFQGGGRNSLQIGGVFIQPAQQTEAAYREAWIQAYEFYVKPTIGGLPGL